MPIDRSARDVLFGTPIVSHQILKYMAQRKSCTVEELFDDFSDLSKGMFLSTVFKLTSRSILSREGDRLTYIGDPLEKIKGHRADRAWKAALMMDTFTSDRLATIAEIEQRYATILCRSWEKDGYVALVGFKRVGFNRFKVYRVANRAQVRPRVKK